MYKVPEIVLVGYGRTQTYQIRCLKCGRQFFPGKKVELFCDKCLNGFPLWKLDKRITNNHLSPVQCVGTVVGWENRVAATKNRSRYNYVKVYNRDSYTCQYCGYNPRTNKLFLPLHIDHITPHSYGGGYKMDNLVVACATCNHIASNKVFNSFDDKKKYVLQTKYTRGYYVSNYHIKAYELKEDTEKYGLSW